MDEKEKERNELKEKRTSLPLVEALMTHQKKKPYSYHVPGHKNGWVGRYSEDVRSFLSFDQTELSGLDDLHDPSGPIAEAESLLANYYQSHKSFFLVGGSTVGNLAAILSCVKEGEEVFVQKNCHKSVMNGVRLAKGHGVFLPIEWDDLTLSVTGVSSTLLKEAICQYPHVKVCILTYPTYYGITYNIKELIEICHENGMVVIVDEAHGAHFGVGAHFPQSSLLMGADIVIHSAHKTLPAMTMGSYLHIGSNRVDGVKVKEYLSLLQSSSPSYPIMMSLDWARDYLSTYNEQDEIYYITKRASFIQALWNVEGLFVVETDDPLKLLLRCEGYNGQQVLEALFREGVYAELGDSYQVLMVLPLLKEGEETYLEASVESIRLAVKYLLTQEPLMVTTPVVVPQHITSLVSIPDGTKTMEVDVVEAEGKVSAETLIPYPPGVPVVLKGELMKREHRREIERLLQSGVRFQGSNIGKSGKVLTYLLGEQEDKT
ncbi:hypothetical protein Q75_15255 [Bacillus coahuilensis p1.1.43]|uniref:Uncharacterized protein n=1 Tax=Bacillus coahuilensis p1.1.43 TaxID=1150625 RepID=A0A147K4Y5_9BACI|nr:hypothetical protein Q75_15255 [Bacillus coahuilensis p1.1.43]